MRQANLNVAKIRAGMAFLVTHPVSALDQISCGGRCPPAGLR